MTDNFKKWLCEKASGFYCNDNCNIDCLYYVDYDGSCNAINKKITLEILIKAMWAINREGKYSVIQSNTGWYVEESKLHGMGFRLDDYNDSEQKALTKALEYIYKQENE